jgi:hypothetical protein
MTDTTAPAAASASVSTDSEKKGQHKQNRKIVLILVGVALFCLMFGVVGGWQLSSDGKQVADLRMKVVALEASNKTLTEVNEKFTKQPKEFVGATTSEISKLVGEKCEGKNVYLPPKEQKTKVAKNKPLPPVMAQRPLPAMQENAQIPAPPPSGKFWGWVHPNATPANKRTCFADRQINGMPAQCSSVEIFSRAGSESEEAWNARVAAKNGIAVGLKDPNGTIKATTFARVTVQ